MSRKRRIGAEEALPAMDPEGSAGILAEAHRILEAGDAAALAPGVSLAVLSAVLADTFDLSYTAERVVGMLGPEPRRRLAGLDRQDGLETWLPADVVAQLQTIDAQPLVAIRILLASRDGLAEPGSEDHCRHRRCSPEILLPDPGSWACRTCGLTGSVERPLNPVIRDRLADQKGRVQDLHALAGGLYETWAAAGRFTAADCTAHRFLGGRADRNRLNHLLAALVQAGIIEEAPGPRGGTGYRVLDEPPDWIADALAERREQRETEARLRSEQAAAVERALEAGLTYTTAAGQAVAIDQNERGLELRFPAIPDWNLREEMKRRGNCRWDARRRRWCRPTPVATVEPWLAAALDAGASVEPYGSADPDAEDWSQPDWFD